MVLFYLLISSMPFMRHPLFGAAMAAVTVTKYLGAVCVFYALYRMFVAGRIPRFFSNVQSRFFVAFILLTFASYAAAGNTSQIEMSPFALYLSLLLQFFITPVIVDSTEQLRKVLTAILVSVAIASLYVLREWVLYHATSAGFRPGYVTGDSNYFGVTVVAALPATYHLFLSGPTWRRLFLFGCAMVSLLALMLGASRGGFLGIAVACLYIVLHSARPVRSLIAITFIFLLTSLAVPDTPIRRLLSPTNSDDGAVEARTVAWKAGMRMIIAHPLTGVGLGNFKSLSASYEDPDNIVVSIAHNTYIEMAAETGLPGAFLFMGIQFFSFRSMVKARRLALRNGQESLARAALGLQSGLVGTAVALCFVSGQIQKLFWLDIFLTMCLPALLRRRVKRRRVDVEQADLGTAIDLLPYAES